MSRTGVSVALFWGMGGIIDSCSVSLCLRERRRSSGGREGPQQVRLARLAHKRQTRGKVSRDAGRPSVFLDDPRVRSHPVWALRSRLLSNWPPASLEGDLRRPDGASCMVQQALQFGTALSHGQGTY